MENGGGVGGCGGQIEEITLLTCYRNLSDLFLRVNKGQLFFFFSLSLSLMMLMNSINTRPFCPLY